MAYFRERGRLRPRVKECVLERMKGHEHFITCSIVVSKYLVPDRDSNDRIDSKGGLGIQLERKG